VTSPPADRLELVERLLSAIRAWIELGHAVRGLALVGSYARGMARPDSDIDVLLLVENPAAFPAGGWLDEIDWPRIGASPADSRLIQYGVVWSNHVRLDNSLEVELSFAPLSWAAARPLDLGTRQVISDGCRILYDPDGLLGAACAIIANGSKKTPQGDSE
jgi:hypothetical protein